MHDTEELVANYDQGNLGIGIVRLKRASSAPAPGKRAVRLA
jgi:hypothetical protein